MQTAEIVNDIKKISKIPKVIFKMVFKSRIVSNDVWTVDSISLFVL